MKYTQTTLDKIDKMIEESCYIVRYERGSFQSGFCILEDRKVVVLNKFLQLEGRINTLIDLVPQLKFSVMNIPSLFCTSLFQVNWTLTVWII